MRKSFQTPVDSGRSEGLVCSLVWEDNPRLAYLLPTNIKIDDGLYNYNVSPRNVPNRKPNANIFYDINPSNDLYPACCSQARGTEYKYGLKSFFHTPICPTVSPCSSASQDSNDSTPWTSGASEDKRLLLDEVLFRIPCIRTDLDAMVAWTDVKEVFFPRCSSKNCNIVKNVLKRQFKFPHEPRRMHACTPDEQLTFLQRCFHLVSPGTLLVEVEAVLNSLDSLQMIVANQHLATKDSRNMECSYAREKEVYKKNNPTLNWNRVKQKQKKSGWHLLPAVIGGVRIDGPMVILDPQNAFIPLSMLKTVFPEHHQQMLVLAANYLRNIDDSAAKRCSVQEAKLLNMWHLNFQGSSSLLVTSNDLLVKWRDVLAIVEHADGGSPSKLTSLNERDIFRRTRKSTRQKSDTKTRTSRHKGKRKSKELPTATVSFDITTQNAFKPESVENHSSFNTSNRENLNCQTAANLRDLPVKQQILQNLQIQQVVPDIPTTNEDVDTVDSSTSLVVCGGESNTFQEGYPGSKTDTAASKDASEDLCASESESARSNAAQDKGSIKYKSRYRRSARRRSERRSIKGKTDPSSSEEESSRDSIKETTMTGTRQEALPPAGNSNGHCEKNYNKTGNSSVDTNFDQFGHNIDKFGRRKHSFLSVSDPRVPDSSTDDAGGCEEGRADRPQTVVVGEASTSGTSPRGNSNTTSDIYRGFRNIANLFTILSNDEVCRRTHLLTLDEVMNKEKPKNQSPRGGDDCDVSAKRLRSRVVPSGKGKQKEKQNNPKYTEPNIEKYAEPNIEKYTEPNIGKYTEPNIEKSTNKNPQTESQMEETRNVHTSVSITEIIKNMDTMFNSLKPDPLAIARAKIKVAQHNGYAYVQIDNGDVSNPAQRNLRALDSVRDNLTILVKRRFDKIATKPSTQSPTEQQRVKGQTEGNSTALPPHLGPQQSKPQEKSISSILKNESYLRDSNPLSKNSEGMTSASEVNNNSRSTNARSGNTRKEKCLENVKDVTPPTAFRMSNERNVLKSSDKSSDTRKPHWDLKVIFGKSSNSNYGKRGFRDDERRANMDADFHAMKEKVIARTKSQATPKHTSAKDKIAIQSNIPVALTNGSTTIDGKHQTKQSEESAKLSYPSVTKLCNDTASESSSGDNDTSGRTPRNEKLLQRDEKLVHTEQKLVEVPKKIAQGKELVKGDEKLVWGEKLGQGEENLMQGEKLAKGDEKLVQMQERIVQGEEKLIQVQSKKHPKIDEDDPRTKETIHAYTSKYDITSYWKGFPTGECYPGRGSPRQRHLTYPTDRSTSTSIACSVPGVSRCVPSKPRASSLKPIILKSFPEIVQYARSVSADWSQVCKWQEAQRSGCEPAACSTTPKKQVSPSRPGLPTIRIHSTSQKVDESSTVSRKSRRTLFDYNEATAVNKNIQKGSVYPRRHVNLEDRKLGNIENSHPSSGIKVTAVLPFHDKARMTTANNVMKLKDIRRITSECRRSNSPEQQIAIQKRKGPKHLENGDVLKWNDTKELWAIETKHKNSNENNSESTNGSVANKVMNTSSSCDFDDLIASAMNSFEIARKCLLKSKDSSDTNKSEDSNDNNTKTSKDSNDSNTNILNNSNDKNTNNNIEDPQVNGSSESRNSCSPHGSDADISSGPSTNGSCPHMLDTEAEQTAACPPSTMVIRGRPIKKNILLRETLKDNFDLIKNISTQICTCKEALSFLKRDKNASRKVFLRKWYLEMMRHCPLHSEETQHHFQEQMFKVMKCLQANGAEKKVGESSGKSVKTTSIRKTKVKTRKRVKNKVVSSEIKNVFPERAVSNSKGRSLKDQVTVTAAKEYLAAYTHNHYKKELLERYEYEKVVSDVSESKPKKKTRGKKLSSHSTTSQSAVDKDSRKESRELKELRRRLAPRDCDVMEQKLFMDILKGTSRTPACSNEDGLPRDASGCKNADRSASDSTVTDTDNCTSREDEEQSTSESTVSCGLETSNGNHSNPSNKIQYLAIIQSDTDLNISYSGFAHVGDSILPYVIENGYKFTTLKEAASLFPGCSCFIMKSVLKKHLGLPRTFCSWEQVSLLTALNPRDSKTKIQTGDMIVRVDSLVQQLPEIETVLKSRHKTSTSKKSKACLCAQD